MTSIKTGFKIYLAFLFLILHSSSFSQPVSRTVLVTWDSNKEKDLAGYKIHYGLSPGHYDKSLPVGKITSYEVDNLVENKRYYFAVTAIDYAGNESDYSNELNIVIRPALEDSTNDDDGDNNDGNENNAPVSDEKELSPMVYNFPNPFKGGFENTTIRYELKTPAVVTIKIYDVNSDLVKTIIKNISKREGEHTEDVWDGTNRNGDYVSNGVYFCTVQTQKEQQVIKIAIKR